MKTPRRKTKVSVATQESGKVILQLGLVSFVAFIVLHIDFLALSSSALIAIYLASRLLSRLSLSGIEISISTKQIRTEIDAPIQAYLTLSNHNRHLPIFHPIVSVREKSSLRIQVFQFNGKILPGQTQTLSIDPSMSQRGLRCLEAFAPRSRYPFALHQATAKTTVQSKEIIVWPRPAALDVDSIFNEPPLFRYNTLGEQVQNTQETEASRIRDYQAGDPKPQINWKLSAKLDKLTVIEPRNEHQERYELHLDASRQLWKTELAFERMLRLVTSLVSELSRRKLVQGITIDELYIPLATRRQKTRFYDTLATLKPSSFKALETQPSRRNHLWILPAPNSQITLASQRFFESGRALAK